ncbi:DMT family transporter [Sulfoacidibacillus thermotolerans]|uniref:EamA domain-containing protein n=1 Tax=Sulfoacidibacillus thermotolerans TaxID=1765684 RepID=A0A2U3D9V1_SULT2|nr:DMT family transporter [Sulfoacidibacillus thermotolerans]PWI58051.1 hypothetical protein BM613_05110 [Sulfoacidibacillus thermotolerans]
MSSSARPIVAYIWLCIGIVAISFAAIFIKMTTAPAAITAFYRMVMTAVLLSPFAFRGLRDAVMRLTYRERWLFVLSGVALTIHFIFWIQSLFYTSVASSTLVLALQPIFVLLLDRIFFGVRVKVRTWLYAWIAIFGTAVIGWHDLYGGKTALLGDLLAVFGTVAVSIYFIAGQSLRRKVSSVHYSFLVYLVSGVLLAGYSVWKGYSFVDYSRADWEVFVLLTLIPTVFGHTLFNTLLKYLPASTIAMGIVGEPIGATVLSYFLLHASIPLLWYVGAVFVVGGVVLFLRSMHSTNVPPSET